MRGEPICQAGLESSEIFGKKAREDTYLTMFVNTRELSFQTSRILKPGLRIFVFQKLQLVSFGRFSRFPILDQPCAGIKLELQPSMRAGILGNGLL